MASPAPDTKLRLMDVAERLFAERGFEGVGVRELTTAAGANLGAITYHFGSKEELLVQTFLRRFRPTNEERARRLQAVMQGHPTGRVPVTEVVEAMLRPPLETASRHPYFPVLLSRILSFPPACIVQVLDDESAASVVPFLEALRLAMPDIPTGALTFRVRLAGGALLATAAQMRGRSQKQQGTEFEAALHSLVQFVSAGLAAPLTREEQANAERASRVRL